jgi:hypothetical protein
MGQFTKETSGQKSCASVPLRIPFNQHLGKNVKDFLIITCTYARA